MSEGDSANIFNPTLQLKEVFGAGTACVVCPVNRILYLDEVYQHVIIHVHVQCILYK